MEIVRDGALAMRLAAHGSFGVGRSTRGVRSFRGSLWVIGLAVCGLMLTAWPAGASVLVVSPDSGTLRTGNGFTLGGSFVTGAAVQVSALGVWVNGTSLADPKPVTIWDDATAAVVATATVPAGPATLDNEFEYAPITPVTLTAGKRYTIGVFYDSSDPDMLHDQGGTPTMSSDFNSYQARFTGGNALPGAQTALGI
jgi:hypothetical protein